MSYGPVSRGVTLLDSASANSSVRTSSSLCVADARQITLSIQTSGGGASRYTVWATNGHGFNTALGEGDWSVVSSLVSQGVFTLDPAFRFMRVTRSAIDSQGTVIVHTRT